MANYTRGRLFDVLIIISFIMVWQIIMAIIIIIYYGTANYGLFGVSVAKPCLRRCSGRLAGAPPAAAVAAAQHIHHSGQDRLQERGEGGPLPQLAQERRLQARPLRRLPPAAQGAHDQRQQLLLQPAPGKQLCQCFDHLRRQNQK